MTKGAGVDLHQGLVIAEEFTSQLLYRINETIIIKETVKKIPDYNADLVIMMAMKTTQFKTLTSDPRIDDKYIFGEELEP